MKRARQCWKCRNVKLIELKNLKGQMYCNTVLPLTSIVKKMSIWKVEYLKKYKFYKYEKSLPRCMDLDLCPDLDRCWKFGRKKKWIWLALCPPLMVSPTCWPWLTGSPIGLRLCHWHRWHLSRWHVPLSAPGLPVSALLQTYDRGAQFTSEL